MKEGGVKEAGKVNQLSTRSLHQGAAGLNDKVPIKPRWSRPPAAKHSQLNSLRWIHYRGVRN